MRRLGLDECEPSDSKYALVVVSRVGGDSRERSLQLVGHSLEILKVGRRENAAPVDGEGPAIDVRVNQGWFDLAVRLAFVDRRWNGSARWWRISMASSESPTGSMLDDLIVIT